MKWPDAPLSRQMETHGSVRDKHASFRHLATITPAEKSHGLPRAHPSAYMGSRGVRRFSRQPMRVSTWDLAVCPRVTRAPSKSTGRIPPEPPISRCISHTYPLGARADGTQHVSLSSALNTYRLVHVNKHKLSPRRMPLATSI